MESIGFELISSQEQRLHEAEQTVFSSVLDHQIEGDRVNVLSSRRDQLRCHEEAAFALRGTQNFHLRHPEENLNNFEDDGHATIVMAKAVPEVIDKAGTSALETLAQAGSSYEKEQLSTCSIPAA